MRIVLDTNILARARTGPNGPAGEVLRLVLRNHLLVLSPHLVTELSRVLRYPRMRAMHRANDDELNGYVSDVQRAACIVVPTGPLNPPVVEVDPDDDAVIATALAGAAAVICTRDRHLLRADVREKCLQLGIRVVDDMDLLAELRE